MQGVLKKVTSKMGKLNVEPGPTHDNIIAKEDRGMSNNEAISHDVSDFSEYISLL